MIDAKDLKCTCCGEVGTMREFIKVGDYLQLLQDGITSKDKYKRFVCSKCSHVDFYWSCLEDSLKKEGQVKLYEKFVVDINERLAESFLDVTTKIKARFQMIYDKELKDSDSNFKPQVEAIINKLNAVITNLKNVMIYIGPFSVVNGELKLHGSKGIENVLLKTIMGDASLEHDAELKVLCDYLLSFKETGANEIYRLRALKRYKASGYEYTLEDAFYRLMNFKFAYMVANGKKRLINFITFTKQDTYITDFDKKYFDEIKKQILKIEIPTI